MKPKTEELLHLLLWSAHMLMRPTFRNLTDSYESWAYRNGFLRQVNRLESQRVLERDRSRPDARIYRLTRRGRLLALGGRDPVERWSRRWDGRWRMVLFDVPVGQDTRRQQWRRYLRGRGFGYLQNSVWISPDPLDNERKALAGAKIDVGSLILMEGRPCGDESDALIVACAWDFEGIHRRYVKYMQILKQLPSVTVRNESDAQTLSRWAKMERRAWLAAVQSDPLLPSQLLPADYRGKQAWDQRIRILARAAKQMRAFKKSLRS